jgi:hypothetical protein
MHRTLFVTLPARGPGGCSGAVAATATDGRVEARQKERFEISCAIMVLCGLPHQNSEEPVLWVQYASSSKVAVGNQSGQRGTIRLRDYHQPPLWLGLRREQISLLENMQNVLLEEQAVLVI